MSGVKSITHYKFADDRIFLAGASVILAQRIKKVLDLFLFATGGMDNNLKFKSFALNTPLETVNGISQVLG